MFKKNYDILLASKGGGGGGPLIAHGTPGIQTDVAIPKTSFVKIPYFIGEENSQTIFHHITRKTFSLT